MAYRQKPPTFFKSALKQRKYPSQEYDKNFGSLTESKSPIFRKDLDKGILGEANDDGTIFVDKSIKPGSALEKKVVKHEEKHMKDMASGKLGYTDDSVTWKGKEYKRKDGNIINPETGEAHPEGWDGWPWEGH